MIDLDERQEAARARLRGAPRIARIEADRPAAGQRGVLGDRDGARRRRMLCRFRGDGQSIEAVAAEFGATTAEVRAALDLELRRDGTTLAEFEARASNRRLPAWLGGSRDPSSPKSHATNQPHDDRP